MNDLDLQLLEIAAAHVPTAIATPVVRWRKLVRLIDPPADHRASDKAFQAVAGALADYAGRDGRSCRPTIDQLASATRFSERSVQYALRALEERHLVQSRQRGRAHAADYLLWLPPALQASPLDPLLVAAGGG